MNKYFPITLLIVLLLLSSFAYSQDDLFNLIGKDSTRKPKTHYANYTFKTTRIVIGQSVENVPANNINVIISHNFGPLNQGPYNLFGLDQSTIRLGLEYGIFKRLTVGVGRSSYLKTYDGYYKFIIAKQHKGGKSFPLSISLYSNMTVNSLKWQYPDRKNYFSSRLDYVHEILVARKVNEHFSIQLTPSYIHRNLVPLTSDHNDLYAVGIGARYLLTHRFSLNAEYYYNMPNRITGAYQNSLSFGVDIETGGHVFQVRFSNSDAMFERGFITETTGSWQKGYIHLGFNIMRYFEMKKTPPAQKWQ